MDPIRGGDFPGVRAVWKAVLLLSALLLVGAPAGAAIIPVTTQSAPETTGDGKCGLLEAVFAAQNDVARDACPAGSGGDTISLPPGTYPISSALEAWSSIVTFQGAGMHQTTIVLANEAPPSFLTGLDEFDCPPSGVHVSTSASMGFSDLTLRPAVNAQNQAVCVASGELRLDRTRVTGFDLRGIWAMYAPNSNGVDVELAIYDSLIDDNHAYSDEMGGAGIFFYSTDVVLGGGFEIHRSSIVNNFSEGRAGGIYVGASDLGFGNRHMENVTISGNFAAHDGGGIYYDMFASYLQIDFMTITNNHAGSTGGGIFKSLNSGNFQLGSSLITGNTADLDSQQRNLSVDADAIHSNSVSCLDTVIYLPGTIWNSMNRPSTQAEEPCFFNTSSSSFGSLAGRGGQNNLPVHRLLSGSVGIDTAVFTTGLDGRNLVRPVDGDNNGSKLHDRGALEQHPFQLETEGLTMVSKSAFDNHVVTTDGCAAPTLACLNSGGSGTNLQANATNDFVIYRTATLPTGTFAVSVRFKRAPNAGRFRLAVSNSQSGPFTNIGTERDGFAGVTDFTTANLGNITINTSGQKFFRFTVTGKSGASSGFQVFPDTIDLVK